MSEIPPVIAVLGASGLIGQNIAFQLVRDGFTVLPIARRFTPAQKTAFGEAAIECPIVELDQKALTCLFLERKPNIVINCIGLLQSRGHKGAREVHCDFISSLVEALKAQTEPVLLIHISVPGQENDDPTLFSRTKHEGDKIIVRGGIPFVILRPGFVIAPGAYGGGALVRALAASPFELPKRELEPPLAIIAIEDITHTVAAVIQRWRRGEKNWSAVWDVMERNPSALGGVIEAFRRRFGRTGTYPRLPSWLTNIGAIAGDISMYFGWAPPIRTTALYEIRRGVTGDPSRWIAEIGIQPTSLIQALQNLPATVQERWFARLFFLKPLVIGCLAVFWAISGTIALTVAFDPATEILVSRGLPLRLAQIITVASSFVDIGIGLGISFKRTCRAGLLCGIGVSLFYMICAAGFTPDLWIEPLGALVKTGPAIVLMLVALAIFEER